MTLLNWKHIDISTYVKPSTKCPAYMHYQAFGRIVEIRKGNVTIINKTEGLIKFPIRYLKLDKEKTLEFKLTGEDPYE